jgi:hypothetical protein
MNDSVEKIDDLIKYIESPEYLRMVAREQDEDPSSLVPSAPLTFPSEMTDNDASDCPCGYCGTSQEGAYRPASTAGPLRLSLTQDRPQMYAVPLRDLRPFITSTNNLRGVTEPESESSGQLPEIAGQLWRTDFENIDYVVYSYATPIAWRVRGTDWAEWVVPSHYYSRTMSRHQNKIRTALEYNQRNIVGSPSIRVVLEEGIRE